MIMMKMTMTASAPTTAIIAAATQRTTTRRRRIRKALSSNNTTSTTDVTPPESLLRNNMRTQQPMAITHHVVQRSRSKRRRRQRPTTTTTTTSFLLFLLLICLCLFVPVIQAKFECTLDIDCQTRLHINSKCIEGYCNNPYQYGCLQSKLPNFSQFKENSRVCNSEDPIDAIEKGLCRLSKSGIDYSEIRIMSQNWESPFFEAWILQILLSEVLDVPVTLESGIKDVNVNFYNPEMRFEYGMGYDYDGLERASKIENGDCTQFLHDQKNVSKEEYLSCGHAILELWSGYTAEIENLQITGAIEPLSFIGVIGEEDWFIPKYTGSKDSTLLSHFGLMGEENRRKLADRFLRPTTFETYCNEVHPNNCLPIEDDDDDDDDEDDPASTTNSNSNFESSATRPPLDSKEGARYHVPDIYKGHFRKTEDNDCDKWPTNCTGHFLDYPCGWSSEFIQQAHHLNIALKSSGNEPGSNGYLYGDMVDVWTAANATKADIIGMWWRPEALYQQYQNTDFEFQSIGLPPPTHQCMDNRAAIEARCGDDDIAKVGNELGVCDVPPIPNYKIISTGLHKLINDPSIVEPLRSPAYQVIKEFTIDGFILGEIFDYWLQPNVDKFGFDPRDAVCRWVSENYDDLQRLIPKTYPREVQENTGGSAFDIVAITLGAVAAAATFVAVVLTIRQRKKRVFVFAQIEFVYMLLFGLMLVSSAAVITALPPTDPNCVATAWLVNVGYSFELLPLVVKIAAINSMMQAAKKMRRIVLGRTLLFGVVAVLTGIVVFYMTIWTIIDPPKKAGEYQLTDQQTEDGRTIVSVAHFCESSSEVWMLVAVSVQGLVLLCASVLAFMTRKMRKDINEANTIAFLIYWNFVCVLLRIILFLLQDKIDVAKLNRSLSIILASDSLATIVIYFVPKFRAPDKASTARAQQPVSFGLHDIWGAAIRHDSPSQAPSSDNFEANLRKPGPACPCVSWADDNELPLSMARSDSFSKNEPPPPEIAPLHNIKNGEEKEMDTSSSIDEEEDVTHPTVSSTDIACHPTISSADLFSQSEGNEVGHDDRESSHRSVSAEEVWMAEIIKNADPSSELSMKVNPHGGLQDDPENQFKSWM